MVDGIKSVILPQVTFGITVRMAVMSIVAETRPEHEDTDSRWAAARSGYRFWMKKADLALVNGVVTAIKVLSIRFSARYGD